jgi:hypothetical protein
LSFGTQAQSTISAPKSVTITNTGPGTLDVSGLTFTGWDPQDHLVTSNGCMGPVVSGDSCTVGVNFAPQELGAGSASLQIATNDPNSPASVSVSGTGGQLPQGPAGQTGPTGATGPRGVAGKIELVVCKPIGKAKRQKCTAKLVSGRVKFTTNTAQERARVSRAGALYATGYAVPTARGHWTLVLTRRRNLRPGRYTLTVKARRDHSWVTQRRSITLD